MRITVEGETALVVTAAGEGLEIEEEGGHFGPLEMLAASLATCTVAVLASWGGNVGLEPDDLTVRLEWEYADDPYRVGRYDLQVRWPSVPEERRARARRVVEACTVHHTLTHPPEMEVRIGG